MDAIEEWAVELRLRCSEATVRAYTGALRDLVRHAGVAEPGELRRRHVVAWLGQPHLGANTRALYLRRIAAYARWAGRKKLVKKVVAAPYRDPEVPVPTDAEVAAMWAACRDDTDRALMLLMAGLGLRVSEAVAVRGEDVTDMHLTVHGKGGRVDRLPVDAAVRQMAGRMPATGWWFPSQSGCGHLTADGALRRVARLGVDAGAGHVTPHQLRRWYATSLSRHGAPLAVISRLLRHRSVTTTMIYVRPDDRDLRAARACLPGWGAA